MFWFVVTLAWMKRDIVDINYLHQNLIIVLFGKNIPI